MTYSIQSIDLYVRETAPARFASALGKQGRSDEAAKRVTSPIAHARMAVRDSTGQETFGCAADRLSVRWLDKRPRRDKSQKLRELVALIHQAASIWQKPGRFDSPFEHWLGCYCQIMAAGRRRAQEDLTSSFASALFERAMLDGVARLAGKSLFDALGSDGLGFRPDRVHAELRDVRMEDILPAAPRTQIFVRHTVGLFDPLTEEDWPKENRLNDGLPETLSECIDYYGLRHFKVKISGDVEQDLERLARIWEILPHEREPIVTLDANEAFADLEKFAGFVRRLEREQLGLFQHIAFIEQPLQRGLTFDKQTEPWIRRIRRDKPLVIDEADKSLDSFPKARRLGYAGASHKNCKGVFKSLLNRALVWQWSWQGEHVFQTAEDLQNLPLVPLHQDFVSVGMLDLEHCERNGHHYNRGLSMLSEKEKEQVARHHRDLYARRGGEWYLKIRDGRVTCGSLQCPGFGVREEPDWASMENLDDWLERRYRAG